MKVPDSQNDMCTDVKGARLPVTLADFSPLMLIRNWVVENNTAVPKHIIEALNATKHIPGAK